jgi:hypothetical protein
VSGAQCYHRNPVKIYEHQYLKLRAWDLSDYSAVVWVDADVVLLRAIDDVFGMARSAPLHIVAAPDCCPPSLFSTGLLGLKPNATTFQHMLAVLGGTHLEDDGGQTGFLNRYFEGNGADAYSRWKYVPYWYNFLKHNQGNHFSNFLNTEFDKIRAIHHIGPKPWTCHRKMDCAYEQVMGGRKQDYSLAAKNQFAYVAPAISQIWWSAFDGLCQSPGVTCQSASPLYLICTVKRIL